MSYNVFLPIIQNGTKEGKIQENIQEFLRLIREHPEQRRSEFNLDDRLMIASQEKSIDIIQYQFFSHFNPVRNEHPNALVRRHGYPLRESYPSDSNQIESIVVNAPTPEIAVTTLLNSPGHRVHVLGLDGFFAEQIIVGAGYYYEDNINGFNHNYTFISCPR